MIERDRKAMPLLGKLLLGAALAVAASPAMAASEISTRVVECRSQTCLLISGKRDHGAAAVAVNGHAVPVEGGRRWSIRLPIDTLRAWLSLIHI